MSAGEKKRHFSGGFCCAWGHFFPILPTPAGSQRRVPPSCSRRGTAFASTRIAGHLGAFPRRRSRGRMGLGTSLVGRRTFGEASRLGGNRAGHPGGVGGL